MISSVFGTLSESSSSSGSSASASSSKGGSGSSYAPSVTQLAVFTAGGDAVFTITRLSGTEAVNGEVISPGAPAQLIGDQYVSEGTKGVVYVGGQSVAFQAASGSGSAGSSAGVPTAAPGRSIVSHEGSSSQPPDSRLATAKPTSQSSSAGVPIKTAEAKIAAVLGVVVGAMVL